VGAWSVRASVDFLDAKDVATGQRLTRRAAHQESLGLDWAEAAWSAGGALLGVGARPEGGAQLAAYQLLDLYARYRVARQWRIEARLLNALDKSYEPARDYQAPGRQAWIGLRYDGAGF
jgi:vitamin B12 transporter